MAEKKEVAVKEEEAVLDPFGALGDLGELDQFAEDTSAGLEDIDSSDIKIPTIKILQTNSDEVQDEIGKAGQLYNTVSKQPVDSMDLVFLKVSKTRTMFPAEFSKSSRPECRSNDAINKFSGIGASKCADCEYSQWKDGETPRCTMSYAILAVDTKTNQPVKFYARGANVSITKDFISALLPRLKTKSGSLGLFTFIIRLSTVKVKGEKGTYNSIVYTPVGRVTAQQYQDLDKQYKALQDLFKEDIEYENSVAHDDDISADAKASAIAGEAEVITDEEDIII